MARASLCDVKIAELGHLVLYVRDIDASAAFYTDVLGFRPVIDRPPGQRGVMYRTGSDRTHHDGNKIALQRVAGVDWRSDPTVINKYEPIQI